MTTAGTASRVLNIEMNNRRPGKSALASMKAMARAGGTLIRIAVLETWNDTAIIAHNSASPLNNKLMASRVIDVDSSIITCYGPVFCPATSLALAEGINNKVSLMENSPINDCPVAEVIQDISACAP